ncbi:hypothetical protein EV2_010512 [Malus domestica]
MVSLNIFSPINVPKTCTMKLRTFNIVLPALKESAVDGFLQSVSKTRVLPTATSAGNSFQVYDQYNYEWRI